MFRVKSQALRREGFIVVKLRLGGVYRALLLLGCERLWRRPSQGYLRGLELDKGATMSTVTSRTHEEITNLTASMIWSTRASSRSTRSPEPRSEARRSFWTRGPGPTVSTIRA
jgi:hypothetical protein